MTTTAISSLSETASPDTAMRLSLRGLASAEFLKITARPSTWWLVALSFGGMVASAVTAVTGVSPGALGVTAIATGGIPIAQILLSLLGVFVITTEYRTGQIRISFTADPGRLLTMAAKAVVAAAVAFVTVIVGEIGALVVAAILVGGPLFSGLDSLGNVASAATALVAAPLTVALVVVMAVALGAAFRRAAPAVVGMLVLLFALPGTAVILPSAVVGPVVSFLPSSVATAAYSGSGASSSVFGAIASTGTIDVPALAGLAVLIAYAVILCVIGARLTVRRDV